MAKAEADNTKKPTASKRMGEGDLKALVSREISLAQSDRGLSSKKQTKALEYYQGKMKDIVAEEGRSSAVSRDLADTMGWMLPGIIRVFTASEHMAVAEPVGREDQAWAAQATDGLNYTFWKENDGYRVIYNATWDSLLSANGVVKTWWDDTPTTKISFHTGLTDDEYTMLVSDDDVEVMQHSEDTEDMPGAPDPVTGLEGPTTPLKVHSVKIKRKVDDGRTRIEAIPPEDYGKDSDSKTCDEARFQFHRSSTTRSDLIEMGFDRKKIEALPKASDNRQSEEIARQQQLTTEDGDNSMDIVDLYECYVKVDIDGDGIAETCRIYYAGAKDGGDILDWEEWEDETPFDDIPCNPMPHRWEAQSIADETMDVQQIKTVLLRQALDNTYATNNPQRFVTGEITNPEELFSPTFGGAIFGKAGSSVEALAIPFVANHAYDAINYQDQVIERRTGVSRQTMALDPEALQNQSATANQNQHDAAYSQIELVARNQAELGWKKVFRKILQLEVKHQDKPRDIRMRGKAITIDPRYWNADMDITINVGLGTGSRDRDLAMLQQVLANQTALTAKLQESGFPDKALEMLPFILTTLKKQAEAAGIKNPEMFYPDVTPQDIQAGQQRLQQASQQPDPKMQAAQMKIQADSQINQAKVQGDQAATAAKLQADQQAAQIKIQQDAATNAQKMDLERQKVAGQLGLKQAQLAAEIQMKQTLAVHDMALNRDAANHAQSIASAKAQQVPVSDVHLGGQPG
ncbi:hypothetical protein EJ076_34825 [Mesorhizobium sp. M7D.F.Ca.US.005.01.1.1]|uniref:portal protein n=1 Tax=Mesorhizobium sp. M7D.F.Ca.US.005.01.1.1 TaxID=2493678 RepID=UPI000F759ACC|nr:hypothetical protein [Mesorhizobium sp. M7D.F.Ca.US.005.01.1.1]AZO45893.1 hypothetical protein EJ076_34825 [Mesorhizobium sp. M7D.F.Ca.US.005.01.1.1]